MYLRTLNFKEQVKFIKTFFSGSSTEVSAYTFLAKPIDFNLTVFIDTWSSKLFYLLILMSVVGFSWFSILKKIILLPFKLGLFSFLYSIIGFDVSWFLNLFNFSYINIPYWIYFQYLNLYNSWLNWWFNTVNIKSISSVPIKEINKIKIKLSVTKDIIETEKPEINNSNKIKYIVGGILIIGGICLALLYFDVFSSNNSRPGPNPGGNSSNNAGLYQSLQDLRGNRSSS